MKLKQLIKELFHKNKGMFGLEVARCFVIEFQKRHLPHAHILVVLARGDKPRTPQHVDLITSAQIPDPIEDSQLYTVIVTSMIYRKCGDNPASVCRQQTPASVLISSPSPSVQKQSLAKILIPAIMEGN